MEWVFAVSPRHALADAVEPLEPETLARERSIVVGDTARRRDARRYGVVGGQPVMAVPTMRSKILAQREGLGVGWLPRRRIAGLLRRGELVEKETADPREPNTLYAAWRGDQRGRALAWWVQQLEEPRFAKRLMTGIEVVA